VKEKGKKRKTTKSLGGRKEPHSTARKGELKSSTKEKHGEVGTRCHIKETCCHETGEGRTNGAPSTRRKSKKNLAGSNKTRRSGSERGAEGPFASGKTNQGVTIGHKSRDKKISEASRSRSRSSQGKGGLLWMAKIKRVEDSQNGKDVRLRVRPDGHKGERALWQKSETSNALGLLKNRR